MKRKYEGLETALDSMSEQLENDIPNQFQQYVAGHKFFPQVGFLTLITRNRTTGQSNYEGPPRDDWEEKLIEGDHFCYKTPWMRKLDTTFGDLSVEIRGKLLHFPLARRVGG